MTPLPSDKDLLAKAESLLAHAHSPYSGVRVAAVAVADDGSLFVGVNVENASLGLTICAERNALAQAVAAGAAGVGSLSGRRIVRLVLTSSHPAVEVPCGACRQVISEIAPSAKILFGRNGQLTRVWDSIAALLPEAFDSRWNADHS